MKRIFLTAALFDLLFNLFAQKPAVWQGGFSGRPDAWDCPKNWREGRVPDESSDVTIPDVCAASLAQPVIRGEAGAINSLRIESGAGLRIEKLGVLAVVEPVEIFGSGRLENVGFLIRPRCDPHFEEARRAAKKAADLAQKPLEILADSLKKRPDSGN